MNVRVGGERPENGRPVELQVVRRIHAARGRMAPDKSSQKRARRHAEHQGNHGSSELVREQEHQPPRPEHECHCGMDRREETEEETAGPWVTGKEQHRCEESGVEADVPMTPE